MTTSMATCGDHSYKDQPRIELKINDDMLLICTATAVFLECCHCGVRTELQEIRHDDGCTDHAPAVGGDIMLTSDFLPFDLPGQD